MASNSARCTGSGNSSHFILTVFGVAKSYDSSTRKGVATVYAELSADSGYAYDGFNVNVSLKVNGSTLGTAQIRACGNSGSYHAVTTASFDSSQLTYDSNGNLSCTVAAELSCSATEIYPPKAGSVSTTLTFPSIGPSAIIPTCNLGNIEIDEDGFNSLVIAGITTLKAQVTTSNAVGVKGWYESGGKTKDLTKVNQWLYSDVVPASESDYTLTFNAYSISSTSNVSDTKQKSITVKGYSLPTYNEATTYTTRCNSSGVADPQGTYGKLYLTWKFTNISGNSIASITVKLNGTTITASSGSITAGNMTFIFALGASTEGDLEITIQDRISSNVTNSLFVPKASIPFSLYEDSNQSNASFGEAANSYSGLNSDNVVNFTRGLVLRGVDDQGNQVTRKAAEVIAGGGGTSRQIFIETSAIVPQGAVEGDLVIVYEE